MSIMTVDRADLDPVRHPIAADEGATAVEYGLMVSLIAVVIILAVTAIGTSLSGIFTNVSGSL